MIFFFLNKWDMIHTMKTETSLTFTLSGAPSEMILESFQMEK